MFRSYSHESSQLETVGINTHEATFLIPSLKENCLQHCYVGVHTTHINQILFPKDVLDKELNWVSSSTFSSNK